MTCPNLCWAKEYYLQCQSNGQDEGLVKVALSAIHACDIIAGRGSVNYARPVGNNREALPGAK